MEEGVLIANYVITRKQFDSGGSVMYLKNEKLDWGEEHPSPSSELVRLQTEEEKENKPLFEIGRNFMLCGDLSVCRAAH